MKHVSDGRTEPRARVEQTDGPWARLSAPEKAPCRRGLGEQCIGGYGRRVGALADANAVVGGGLPPQRRDRWRPARTAGFDPKRPFDPSPARRAHGIAA